MGTPSIKIKSYQAYIHKYPVEYTASLFYKNDSEKGQRPDVPSASSRSTRGRTTSSTSSPFGLASHNNWRLWQAVELFADKLKA
jgi:hypothetical protein